MHKVSYQKGTDARNYIAKCVCGWLGSGTYRDAKSRGEFHLAQDNPLAWHDPMRAVQSDRKYPAYAGWKFGSPL
jgi:hypothetical protein